MNLTFRENYWDDPEAKSSFIDFLNHIHRLDLTLWDRMGFWDYKYRPFSFFDGKSIASSLCVYSMDMIVNGQRRTVAQISGVGTTEEYRRKGLSLTLTEKAIRWASSNHDFFYLFADTNAFELYERAGFRRVTEHKTILPVEGRPASGGVEKLDVDKREHLDLIYRCAAERAPVSNLLGVCNEKLFMFWCLYFLRDNIFYIADLDLLVLYRRADGLVTVCDIVGKSAAEFSAIYPYISDTTDTAVEFLFMVDRLNLGKSVKSEAFESNGTHLLGDFPLEGEPFILPLTCHA